jgi:centrosomal CEP192-like protein
VSLSSTSLAFGSQIVGTNSAAQTLTLKNTGNDILKITGIAVSSDFSETDTCGASVAAAVQCAISVTFTPTTSGARAGTLTITDDAGGSPQTISLSGTGEDFSIAASSNSSATATVAPGQSATYTLSISGQGGLNQPISLSCSGAPAEASCILSPTLVHPTGQAPPA